MKKFNLINITLILVNIIFHVNCEKFSAISEMEKLAYDEEKIIEEFTDFIHKMEGELKSLERKLNQWKDEYKIAQEDVTKYITNPLSAFLMIKRTSHDIQHIENRLSRLFNHFTQRTIDLRPTQEDLLGAVGGLLRLQEIYKLNTKDLVNGVIEEQNTDIKLNIHDIYLLAKGVVLNELSERIFNEYMEELNQRLETNQDEDAVEPVTKLHVEELETLYANTKKSLNPEEFIKNGFFSKEKERILYGRMCRKEGLKSPNESAVLKCRYISNTPFSKLAPFKMEEADHSANLVVFHDVVYDSEIEILKNMSKPRFIRGQIYGSQSNTMKSDQRVAKVAWLKENGNDVLERIVRRVEDMTGLTMETAEELQIQNYGIGGHYQPHWDMKTKGEPPFTLGTGNRIATVLFYVNQNELSTVEKGGATVFPYLRVYVPAVKGMAAFWYNLKDNGDDDYYTRHAACPVLLGSKWVSNKWIHEFGQEFRRPCLPGRYEETTKRTHEVEFY